MSSNVDQAYVTYSVDAGTAIVTMVREENRNALSAPMLSALRNAFARADKDSTVRCVVLTGGESIFSAGGDLKEMDPTEMPRSPTLRSPTELANLFSELWRLSKPTIAVVRGPALAGGFGLALACDFLIAEEGATFGAPEVLVGMFPYMISIPMLQSMPMKTALQLSITGEVVDARRGEALGFVTNVYTASQLDGAISKMVDRIRRASPDAIAAGRPVFYATANRGNAQRLRDLEVHLSYAASMPDAVEGMKAFKEKRKPRWPSIRSLQE